jgi:hypothetical protein
VPFRCGARTCPTCTKAIAAAKVEAITSRVRQFTADVASGARAWDGAGPARALSWRHVVLTSPAPVDLEQRYDPTYLRAVAREVRNAFRRWWLATAWGRQRNVKRPDGRRSKVSRRDTAYVLGLEISPRGMVHIHAAVFGEFIPQVMIEAAWRTALGATRRTIVHVTALRGDTIDVMRKSLSEVLKYATKGEKGARRVERAAAVEVALRRVRRIEVGGALRDYAPIAETVTQEELHAGERLRCGVCAGARFVWIGLRGPELVHHNGGFGLLRVEDFGKSSDHASDYGPGPPGEYDDALT